jgi:hypothetical protein
MSSKLCPEATPDADGDLKAGVNEDVSMANRNFASGGKIYSMYVKPIMVTCTISIGATGAVTAFKGAMVKSVTRNSIGTYTVLFQDRTGFARTLHAEGAMRSPVSGLSGISTVEIQNNPTATMSVASGGSILIKTLSAAGALADPVTGSVVSLLIIADDSSVSI